MSEHEPFHLTTPAVESIDFEPLKAAVAAGRTVIADGLELTAATLRTFRLLLLRDDEGRPVFDSWRFIDTEFGPLADFSRCAIRGCSFRGSHFGPGASFARARFGRAVFKDAHFGDDISFERAEFAGKTEFHGARFGDRARFSRARFAASSQFFATSFGAEAGFARTHFAVRAKFHDARFGPRANFSEAEFPAGADFGASAFEEKLQMAGVTFAGETSFLGANFEARARLANWTVADSLDMQSVHFQGAVSLHGARIGGDAIFDYGVFKGSVDLGDVKIAGQGSFASARFAEATRLGPVEAVGDLLLDDLLILSPCKIEVGARVSDFSGSRFLAPVRLVVQRGDVVLDRVGTGPRLVITAPAEKVDDATPRLISVCAADIGPTLVSGFDVRALRFDGADGIDGLHIESGATFERAPKGARAHREVLAEEHRKRSLDSPENGWYPDSCRAAAAEPEDLGPQEVELARIYRSLRKAREDARDAPGAADFYYGEMEMRRLHARACLTQDGGIGPRLLHLGNVLLLELYRLLGGYGVRPGRPFVAFAALALAAAAYVHCGDLVTLTTPGPHHTILEASPNFEESVVFVLRGALLLPTTTGVLLTTEANWIQIVARVLGPLLLGLFAFGLRARVHR